MPDDAECLFGDEPVVSVTVTLTERHAKRLENYYEALSLAEAVRHSSEEAAHLREYATEVNSVESAVRQAIDDAMREDGS